MSQTYNCHFFFFGLDSLRAYIFFAVYLLVVTTVVFLSIYKKNVITFIAYFLIIIGAGANLYQRATSGCVFDNINFFGLFLFNIFDVMIMVGTVTLIVVLAKSKLK